MNKLIGLIFLASGIFLASNAHAKTADDWLSECVASYDADEYAKALTSCNKAIDLDVDNEGAYRHRGNVKYSFEDYQGAIVDYDKAIELSDGYAFYYYLRGRAHSGAGDITLAYEDYLRFIEQDNRILTYCELIAGDASDLSEEQLKNPKLREFHARCISEFAASASDAPKNEYEKSVAIEAYQNIAKIKILLRDYSGALETYNAAVSIDKNNYLVLQERGALKELMADNEGALKDYNRAVAIDVDVPFLLEARAALYRKLNMKAEACADYQKSAEINGTDIYAEDEEYCKP